MVRRVHTHCRDRDRRPGGRQSPRGSSFSPMRTSAVWCSLRASMRASRCPTASATSSIRGCRAGCVRSASAAFRDYRAYLVRECRRAGKLHQRDLDQSHEVLPRVASFRPFPRPAWSRRLSTMRRAATGASASGRRAARPARSPTRSLAYWRTKSRAGARHDIRILATDIDTDVLGKAARGVYPADAFESVPRRYRDCFRAGRRCAQCRGSDERPKTSAR